MPAAAAARTAKATTITPALGAGVKNYSKLTKQAMSVRVKHEIDIGILLSFVEAINYMF